jgi:hypothetical protein
MSQFFKNGRQLRIFLPANFCGSQCHVSHAAKRFLSRRRRKFATRSQTLRQPLFEVTSRHWIWIKYGLVLKDFCEPSVVILKQSSSKPHRQNVFFCDCPAGDQGGGERLAHRQG